MNTFSQSCKLIFSLALVTLVLGQSTSGRIPLTTKLVHIGDDVRVTCTIDESYIHQDKLHITWENPSGSVIGHGSELILKNVQQADVGQYVCKAMGVINGKLVTEYVSETVVIQPAKLIAQSPPHIIIPQSENGQIHLYETQNLIVDCKVGNWSREEYVVQWIRTDGSIISNSETLYIESVLQNKDQGVYTCAIQKKNNEQDIFKKRVTLTIEVPRLSITILPTERLTIGGLIHRRCEGFKLDQSTETFTYTWMDPSGIRLSRENIIQRLIPSNSVNGQYTCQYKATRSGKVFEIKTEINIASNISTEENIYSISIIHTPMIFRIGERMSFRCAVKPFVNEIVYSWYKDNKFIKTGDGLEIETFTKKDQGTYKCHATGKSKNEDNIDLIAESIQKMNFYKSHRVEMIAGTGTQVQINMRQDKELHCEISLDNDFTGRDVIWTFNGKLLDLTDMRKYRIAREDRSIASILVINNANVDNDGRYECTVGTVKKASTIIVREEIGVLSIYPKLQESLTGHRSEFHCKINNIPNAKKADIQWHFVNKDRTIKISLPDNRWRKELSDKLPSTSFILIDSLELKDNGYMVCSLPTGEEDIAELIVTDRIKPFVVKVNKPIINVQKNQRFEFECFSENKVGGPIGNPTVRFINGSLVSKDIRFEVSKIGPSKYLVVAPNGIDIDSKNLQITCGVDEKIAIVTINVQDQCPPLSRYCNNGECIPSSKFCDGKMDCSDGSDEDPKHCEVCDAIRMPCGDLKGKNSKNLPFYDIHRRCDGSNDCENGFDEQNCPKSQKCNTIQFTCKTGVQIPYSYVCDQQADCDDGEDEIGCREPLITQMSNLHVSAKRGETVKMICEAIGHPLPKIVWRYNWNCLPINNRIMITEESSNCKEVVSVLTIKNFQPEDVALYNCEALAGIGRHLSKESINVSFSKY